jgi:hypothetical protein
MTGTLTITGHDRHRILDDLWAVTGLGEHIDWMATKTGADEGCMVYIKTDAHVAPLFIAHGLLDDPETWASHGILYVHGDYRGVYTIFSLDVTPQQPAVPDTAQAALADLLAAIDTTTGQVT